MSKGSVTRRGALGLALSGAALVALGACSPIYENHGYIPTDLELASITVGKSTQADVTEAIGRPAATGVLEGSGWYYIGSHWKRSGMRAAQEIDRQVVVVRFDKAGVLENVERFGLERGEVVVLSRRVTDSGIKGVGLVRQLLGNLGRLDASRIVD